MSDCLEEKWKGGVLMSNPLELNPLEQLDLRLDMLVSNQARAEETQQILQPQDSDQDFRPHLETSHRIIVEIQRLFQSFVLPAPDGLESDAQCRRTPVADEMDDLRQVLSRAAVLAESLGQLPSISLQQFESFGFFVCQWIAGFREGQRKASGKHRPELEERILPLRSSLKTAVDDRGLQSRLEDVFGRLIYGLCLIRHSQQTLKSCQDRRQLILMMVRCNEYAQGVLAEMDDLQQAAAASPTELGEALCWSSRALKLEIRRVLKTDLHHLDAEVDSDSCCERLDRAIGILLNGFEHTIRHLLSCLDPAFDGSGLLGDLREQYREACRLRKALERLKTAAEEVENSPSEQTLDRLQVAIEEFAGRAFPSLYLRDRRVIEEFAQLVKDPEAGDLVQRAHQFQTFLATLLGEVGNRNVFAEFERTSLVA